MKAINKYLAGVLCGAVVLVSAVVASAQEVPQRRTFSAAPAPAASERPSSPAAANPAAEDKVQETLELPLNKARVMTLSRSVRNIVVGDPAVMDVEFDEAQPTRVILRPKAVGSTNILLMDANGAIIRQIEARVVLDHDGLKAALKSLLPNTNIKVSAFRNSVFLTGAVASAAIADNAVTIATQFVADATSVVNMMTVSGGQQVIIQVRVAEMDRNVRKNLAMDATFSKRFGNLGGRGFDITGTTPASIFADTSFATGTLFTGTNILGNATFEALERQSLAKTLAEPTLTALSGETAKFLSGGSFAMPSGVTDTTTNYEMQEFGISLEFTPRVLDKGRINLHIKTEISAIGTTINNFSSLTTKETETTVEMPSGGTLMISGLLQDDMTDQIDGVPFLKDLPILGALFRSTAFQQQRTELVITVTVYLVKPIDNARYAALPTDGFEEATDIDLYVWGRLHRHYSDSEDTFWENPLKGPFGYIMK